MSGSAVILGAYLIYALAATSLFAIRPPRQAALIAYIGGWLLLPVAVYDPKTITSEGFTLEIIGTALPSDLLLAKALIIPLGVLAGIVWRARSVFRDFRPARMDAAMAAFCFSPLLAVAAVRITPGLGLIQSGYLAGVWGGTWLIGRLLLNDNVSRRALVEAIAVSGLCLMPFAIVEGLNGPRFYTLFYGAHPFYADGAERYYGTRPLALLEHGNQYGIWISMAALAAFSLGLRRSTRSRTTIIIFVVLAACAIASQSVGAILLFALGAAWLMMSNRVRRVTVIVGALLLAAGGAAYLSGKVPMERLAYRTSLGQAAMGFLKSTGRSSLSWRVHRDLESLATIRRAALTGYGRWDWWRPLKSHPWGLTLLLAGQFGLVSLALLAFAMLAGAIRELWLGSAGVLPVIVVLAAMDAQLNSFIYFIAILAAAAIAGQRRSVIESGSERDEPFTLPTGSQHAN